MKSVYTGLLLLFVSLATFAAPTHKTGGPYYFKSFATNFKEPMTLTGEMTGAEAKTHASSGASVYTAWFNETGRPEKIEKHYRGKRLLLKFYKYESGKLIEVRTVNEDGNETVKSP